MHFRHSTSRTSPSINCSFFIKSAVKVVDVVFFFVLPKWNGPWWRGWMFLQKAASLLRKIEEKWTENGRKEGKMHKRRMKLGTILCVGYEHFCALFHGLHPRFFLFDERRDVCVAQECWQKRRHIFFFPFFPFLFHTFWAICVLCCAPGSGLRAPPLFSVFERLFCEPPGKPNSICSTRRTRHWSPDLCVNRLRLRSSNKTRFRIRCVLMTSKILKFLMMLRLRAIGVE